MGAPVSCFLIPAARVARCSKGERVFNALKVRSTASRSLAARVAASSVLTSQARPRTASSASRAVGSRGLRAEHRPEPRRCLSGLQVPQS